MTAAIASVHPVALVETGAASQPTNANRTLCFKITNVAQSILYGMTPLVLPSALVGADLLIVKGIIDSDPEYANEHLPLITTLFLIGAVPAAVALVKTLPLIRKSVVAWDRAFEAPNPRYPIQQNP